MASSEGGSLLTQEILEHILQFTDGQTLLTCHNVSPEFSAAVKYLSRSTSIWKDCFFKERDKYPFNVIGKYYPHNETFRHRKNWGIVYELYFFDYAGLFKNRPDSFNEIKLGKDYSDILDVQTHGNLILVLLKYSRDFSKYCRIFTLNLENFIVDKSSTFFADMLFVTPLENPSCSRRDAVTLSCDSCHLVAVPLGDEDSMEGYPKFCKSRNFLKVEYGNGDVIWLNSMRALTTKANCLCVSNDLSSDDIKRHDSKTVKVFQGFTTLLVTYGDIQKEFNTFRDLRATVSATLYYSSLLAIGTNTGILYVYKLCNEADLRMLELKNHILRFDVCSNSILRLNVMDIQQQLIFICCTEKSLYKIHFKRKLLNLF